MAYRDHIRLCNNYDPARAVPLVADGERLGLVRRDNAEALRPFGEVFAVEAGRVRLVAAGGVAARSRAVERVVEALCAEYRIPRWRNETFDVAPRWGAPPFFRLDRGAVPFFGTLAYGVHLNGYCRKEGEVFLWVGRRAPDKTVAPNKLDNLVAGGIGNGHGIADTLVKEGEEEAAIPPSLMAGASPVGVVSYRMETRLGIRDDVLFAYDLELPADFEPHNRDGEIVHFELMPIGAVLDRIRTTEDFKFNVNLIILDFAVRHGFLGPNDPDYLAIVTGLRRPID
jgi:8-oxo-dGTP pyrophosphatase MutT (NUDIX family)